LRSGILPALWGPRPSNKLLSCAAEYYGASDGKLTPHATAQFLHYGLSQAEAGDDARDCGVISLRAAARDQEVGSCGM
jgi:hypothetical protein